MSEQEERLRRWRLVLGAEDADGTQTQLTNRDARMDETLEALYGGQQDKLRHSPDRSGDLGDATPYASRWLGDIRTYFPQSVVQVMQRDAIENFGLTSLLLEPEILETITPDVHLVATLLSLKSLLPTETLHTARIIVQKLVDELKTKLRNPMTQAVTGSLNRSMRNDRPRYNEIDWNKTILRNLKHYQPAYKTIVPEKLVGYGRKRSQLRDIILCVDQSGSMATSVVYSSIFASVLASLPALKTHLILFSTEVVDMTTEIHDPVELLFSSQLGGGTDINQALQYCQQLVSRPRDTIFVLISDLYEGGDKSQMLKRAKNLADSGVQTICLLALNDDGAPSFDTQNAKILREFKTPCFACTPDLFPELIATALNGESIDNWASKNNIVIV